MKKDKLQIEKLIDILTESELTELAYEETDKIKIKIKKSIVPKLKKEVTKEKEIKIPENIKGIVSEEIGRFFYEDKEGNKIIKVGDKIKEGQKLGELFAMGIKTPMKSTISGEIIEIKVKNGGIVDYGKEIIRVKVLDE